MQITETTAKTLNKKLVELLEQSQWSPSNQSQHEKGPDQQTHEKGPNQQTHEKGPNQ